MPHKTVNLDNFLLAIQDKGELFPLGQFTYPL